MDLETTEKKTALLNCPLFAGLNPEEVPKLVAEKGTCVSLKKGDEVVDYSKKLGIVLTGRLQVINFSGALLNKLTPGSLFGVSTVFTEASSHVTDIFAEIPSEICLLTEEELTSLFQEFPAIFRNYIAFLTDRIRFLNQKIDLFSAGSAEQKLMTYLKHKASAEADGKFTVSIPSMSQLASALGIGRASLYRAADTLEENGMIDRSFAKKWILTEKKKEG